MPTDNELGTLELPVFFFLTRVVGSPNNGLVGNQLECFAQRAYRILKIESRPRSKRGQHLQRLLLSSCLNA